MSPRSYLYVPGNRPDLMAKAVVRGEADALILDLEDAVPAGARAEARQAISRFVEQQGAAGLGPEVWIRVNPGPAGLAEIAELATVGVHGFCLAKAEAPQNVSDAAARCGEAEVRLGLPAETFALMPLLESAAAVLSAREIGAASARVAALQVGEADLSGDLMWTDSAGLGHVRVLVSLASAAAALPPPIAPVDPRFDDPAAFRAATLELRALGYASRACIHPSQVVVANEVFSPTDDQVAEARILVASLDDAMASGTGVLGSAGRLVDAATVRQARRIVETAQRLGAATDT